MRQFISLLVFIFLFLQTVKADTEPNDDATQANQILMNVGQPGSLLRTDVTYTLRM